MTNGGCAKRFQRMNLLIVQLGGLQVKSSHKKLMPHNQYFDNGRMSVIDQKQTFHILKISSYGGQNK
jgi:hypothetical protein